MRSKRRQAITKEEKVENHSKRMVKSYEGDELEYTLDDAVLDVAVYVRVSTSGRTTESQLMDLSEVC